MPRIIITGATGYICKPLCDYLSARGFSISSMTRYIQSLNGKNLFCFPFQLGEEVNKNIFRQEDVVIHLASACMNTSADESTESLDVIGTEKLLKAARAASIKRFIFISSQSASPTGHTPYARSKWRIEQMLTEKNEIIVRPGLVYGAPAQGLYGTLVNLIKILPVFPDIGLENLIQPIHIRELCIAIEALVNIESVNTREFNLGSPQGLSFKSFLQDVAKHLFNKRVFFLPLPFRWIQGGCALASLIPFLPKISADRIKGLLYLQPMSTQNSLLELSLSIRPPTEYFQQESLLLAEEGRAIFYYLCKDTAPILLTEYQNIIMKLPNPKPVLSKILLRWPTLIRFIEPFGEKPLAKRLEIASHLLETDAQKFNLFYNTENKKK